MAKHWLQTCTQNHVQCNRNLASRDSPTRILDISGLEHGIDPRLLQNMVLDSGYVALSHRWGVQGLPSTTTLNLAARLERLPLVELSQTMQDAIQITRELGFKYIWIDALCIIQDSTEDWLREASRMSSVFSGAIVTIAVADADHHAQGIFRPRPARCMRPFRIPYLQDTPYRERTRLDGEGEFYVFPKSSLVGAGNRSKGTLDTRAWILQEQLLSPRMLYYGNGEIYWDCVTVSASESSPIAASLLYDSDPDETWALKLIRRTLAGSTNTRALRRKIADIWTQIIKNYSSRKLTRQSDKLIALEGILKPLAVILEDEPVAGMWRDQLWKQLVWWMPGPEVSIATSSDETFVAPSWSWLSVHAPVFYHNALRSKDPQRDAGAHKFTDLEPLAKIIFAESETRSGVAGILGSLIMSGPSFSYHLTSNDLKKPVHKSWNAAKLKLNTGIWLLDRPLKLPVNIQCVVMAEDNVAKMLVCLCLVPDEDMEGQWKRIGLCHWDGLAWQVPKFVGMELEERYFTIV
ncbi:heterokaryon incompatibility protein-domain-containing protein [Pyrenochaeta sp. MPI-SDFR-AT-0127]|nr:heterokaryon incompatibility protein-domain-containing protein [Pyrenochaeta sp. MPI-SDFR-AT-0127]